ncbi:aconitate hydratase [Marinibaculum pumilum]|uniref:Aconitate hydratase n=1 Tax=Marinibaculum pumilum TaxID=1766165 RepID=A0ABV7KUI6_9PROT
MACNLAQKLIRTHLAEGEMRPGTPIGLRIDQTLTQDATGTLVMLALEALDLDRVRTGLSVQYVDHNLIQADHRNPDDHLFLESACRRFGILYSGPGNGVSHPVHMQRFGRPGQSLLGSDSHSCAAGALGMLAIGAGGLDVAMAMAGEPYRIAMPEVWGIELTGRLPDWVSAKDVILEMLRRHGVDGGTGRIIEYHGPGLDGLSAMDRHVIANMGAELGATTTVFPADDAVRRFLAAEGREAAFDPVAADPDAGYDVTDRIDLSELEPLIARPSSPGNVVPVREVAGAPIYQAYIGSSANPGYRDFAVAAAILKGRQVDPTVSLDVNPTSRRLLVSLAQADHLSTLIRAGARLHQAGCNGCIGMGQAPASGRNSLRTVPRNFPGRSGTREDSVFLCSPETAAASALEGRITDPRDLGSACPDIEAEPPVTRVAMTECPPGSEAGPGVELRKGPNIVSLPRFDPLPDRLELPILLAAGDDLSTDEILPAGSEILPFRSNIPKIAEFTFSAVDSSYPQRSEEARDGGGHAVLGGRNYGQGSSREHAALAPRYLGLRAVLARSFARLHRANLINYGVLPLQLDGAAQSLERGDLLCLEGLREAVGDRDSIEAAVKGRQQRISLQLRATGTEREILLAGGRINLARAA